MPPPASRPSRKSDVDSVSIGPMAHDHSHDHPIDEAPLKGAFLLITLFMLVEAVGGWMTNSLTLIADAGHMFLDASSLGLAWYALRLSQREHDEQLSYGYHRFQV